MDTIKAKGYNGTVEFDGSFVTIKRRGVLARITVGKGDKRIPLRSISAVQWKPAGLFVNGFISFGVAGGNERRSRFLGQTVDATHDENSVIFTKGGEREFEEVRSAIELAITHGSGPQGAAVNDFADQLGKLAALRDAGVLSEEEFAAKKADLLSRM